MNTLSPGLILFVHWVVNPVLWIVSARLVFGPVRWVSFPVVFLVTYFVLIYVGAASIYLNDIPNDGYLTMVWVIPYVVIVFCGMCFFMLRHTQQAIRAGVQRIHTSERDVMVASIAPFLSAFFIAIPILYVVDKGLSQIAILFLILNPGSALETISLRIGGLASNYSPLLTILYSYSYTILFPLYTSVIVSFYSRRLVSGLHLTSVLLAGAVFVVFTGEKAPLAILLFTALLAIYLSRGTRVSRQKLTLTAILALFLPGAIYPLLYGISGMRVFGSIVEGLWRRLTWVPSFTAAVYFDLFPRAFPHQGAGSNRFLARLAGVEYESTAGLVYRQYYGSTIEGGLVNSAYFASFYADWGYAGAICGTLLVCVILVWLQRFYDMRNNDALGAAFRAATMVAVVQLMLTNIYSVALGRGLLSVPILMALLGPVLQRRTSRPVRPRPVPSTFVPRPEPWKR